MAEQAKVDFKRSLKPLFSASAEAFEEIEVPPLRYLMIDGKGSPGTSQAYWDALAVLYPAAYGLKFFSKAALGRDYVVPPLEGLWWAESMDAFTGGRRDEWLWTLMIMEPDWIGPDEYAQALAELSRKKRDIDFAPLRLERLTEGACLQKLHRGSFADEAPVLRRLHAELMPSLGYGFNGKHHEIYLSDPRRVPPEQLRTILRQPVKRLSAPR